MRNYNYELRKLIQESKFRTQEDLADHIGISDGLLSKIVNGRKQPSEEIKNRIIEALGCGENVV